jgi:hypothetical protein
LRGKSWRRRTYRYFLPILLAFSAKMMGDFEVQRQGCASHGTVENVGLRWTITTYGLSVTRHLYTGGVFTPTNA